YFAMGMQQFSVSIANQLVPGTAGGAGTIGSAPLPGAGLPSLGGLSGLAGGGAPVSAGVGQAGSIGSLSVPPSWAAGASTANSPAGMAPFSGISAGTDHGGPSGLLRGMPLGATGRRAAGGFTHRYGFRYSVMPRPPSAG
ncbi:MAG TPA: PE/PPE C-terminal domain-containing protein, partial [Mycobacterium sp.]|uniref:PE/PPE C-terminal domain-containing protein n=1 Tax=Mycobacterium sp. TaxID=1785 RepID=UPI002D4F8BD4